MGGTLSPDRKAVFAGGNFGEVALTFSIERHFVSPRLFDDENEKINVERYDREKQRKRGDISKDGEHIMRPRL